MFSKTILSLIATAMLFTGSLAAAEPVRIIFETDMGNDVDDVLALDMLYKYQDAGKIQLLLISNNKGNAYSAPFIHLMNDFYGWSGIPVASSPAELLPRQKEKQPSYIEAVAASGVFPASSAETFDSVEKYRQVLAAQPDRSVVIVSVGFLSNLKRLLDSAPDRYSELPGRELVARKVRLLTMMGGNFDGQRRREFNIRIDIPAARAVFGRWPTDILVSPWEVGGRIFYRCAALGKIGYAAQHPLKMAYASYLPMPYDRECWDQTAVMAGVEEPAKWFGLSSRGEVEVDEEGRTKFTPAPNGRIRILQTTPGQRKKAEKYIMKLVGQTPEKYTNRK